MEISLADLACVGCDASGTLFGVTAKNESSPSCIAVLDARHEILASDHTRALGESCTTLNDVKVSQIIRTSPSIAFDVRHVVPSRNGRYVALVGYDPEDDDRAVVAVVDVHGGRPIAAASSTSSSTATPRTPGGPAAAAAGKVAAGAGARTKQCSLHLVDHQFYISRPGIIVHQVSWHPHSEAHLAVLTSDSRLRLYHISDLSVPEQTLHLKVNTGAGAGGPSRYGVASLRGAVEATAFAFGPAVGWGMFTLYVLASSGAVYGMCPVAPFGMRCPASTLKQLAAAAAQQQQQQQQLLPLGPSSSEEDAALARVWLADAFGSEAVSEMGAPQGRWAVRRHMLEGASPALQGPLNSEFTPGAATAVSLCATHHLDFNAGGAGSVAAGLPGSTPARLAAAAAAAAAAAMHDGADSAGPQVTSALVIGYSDGRLLAHVSQGCVGPCWLETTPQCVLDAQGEVQAVRCECDVATPPSLEHPGALLLLDVIDLALQQREAGVLAAVCDAASGNPAAAAAAGRLGVDEDDIEGGPVVDQVTDQDDDDQDLDEVAGLGVKGLLPKATGGSSRKPGSGPVTPSQRRPGASPAAAAALAAAAVAAVAALGGPGGRATRRLALAACDESAPHQLWACHRTGVWNVTLSWLPTIGRALASAAAADAAGGSGADEVLRGALAALPPPALHELLPVAPVQLPAAAGGNGAGSGVLVSCCGLSDVFLGSGVIALQAPGVLHFARPRGQVSQMTAQAAAASASAATAPAGSSSAASPAATPAAAKQQPGGDASASAAAGSDAVVESHIQSIYADLVAGPSGASALPKAKGGVVDAAAPEGAAHLMAAIGALRSRHVEFAHRAHHDLKQRVGQLETEVASHAAAATELRALAASVAERQAALGSRLQRAVALHANLVERTGLLTQLHWSLPRPLSEAEQQLSTDLEVYHARCQALAASWSGLRRRAERACEERRQQVSGAGAPAGASSAAKGLLARPGAQPHRSPLLQEPIAAGGAAGAQGLPPAQMEKVHASILEAYKGLSGCSGALKAMEGELKAWKAAQQVEGVKAEAAGAVAAAAH